VVLGDRATGLNFEATATLHNSHAYFNASLLGDIFRRMGLPAESLEFLTRGAKFSRPPLGSTVKNLPGLLRLLQRELWLADQFAQDQATIFSSGLSTLAAIPRDSLSPEELLDRIDDVLGLLRRVTYYNIMGPLSFALRRAIRRMPEADLDAGRNAEIAAVEDLRAIARDTRLILAAPDLRHISNASSLMAALAESTDGQTILAQLDGFIEKYGYLSSVGTDIAVPTWHENPGPVRELLAQFVLHPPPNKPEEAHAPRAKTTSVQRRLDLKGEVNTLYNRLLAELRWCFLAIEAQWLKAQFLIAAGDIFFLTLEEIKAQILAGPSPSWPDLQARIDLRQQRFHQDQQMDLIPNLVFGNDPPGYDLVLATHSPADIKQQLSGIAASAGMVEGPIRVVKQLESVEASDGPCILVVPYTDAGWAPLLARAQGLIAEVGGRLSHGAIIAREYGIPAVMDVTNATQRLHTGQWVRIDGEQGTVDVLEPPA
jgi:pyruvate,water dikinase